MLQPLLTILLVVFLLVLLLWLIGFLVVTDFSVPLRSAKRFQRVLVVFPHADDEAITCGGFLHRLAREGKRVTLVLLTKGEHGPNPTRAGDLKGIRTREAQSVAGILRIEELIQEDFGDGRLREKKQELAIFLATLLEQEQPDLLITYDLSGLYGHSDHIVCSEIMTKLKHTRYPEVPLWYVTLPKRMLARIKPPEDLATDPQFQAKQALPTHKIFVGRSIFPKIRSWYTYESQRASLANGIGKFTPLPVLWFLLSMVLFEYFADEGDSIRDTRKE